MKVFVNRVTKHHYSVGIIFVSANTIEEANNIILEYSKVNCYDTDFFNLEYTIESDTLQTNVEESKVLYAMTREE